uniref:Uncharacterized protein n=1 Tax=Myotis myotis TaxID=51298 RepID=A0A7J8AN76_MYOMY|nr:hypothetical protein mMyoMyo1_008139 [Myotis myotis]
MGFHALRNLWAAIVFNQRIPRPRSAKGGGTPAGIPPPSEARMTLLGSRSPAQDRKQRRVDRNKIPTAPVSMGPLQPAAVEPPAVAPRRTLWETWHRNLSPWGLAKGWVSLPILSHLVSFSLNLFFEYQLPGAPASLVGGRLGVASAGGDADHALHSFIRIPRAGPPPARSSEKPPRPTVGTWEL